MAGRESNCGRLSSSRPSGFGLFFELSEEFGADRLCRIAIQNISKLAVMNVDLRCLDQMYHILKVSTTLDAGLTFQRVKLHRDEVKWGWNRKVNPLANIAAAAFGVDFAEGLFGSLAK